MKVVCPGSFDPITLGHLDVINRAAHLFGEVVVAVGRNSTKQSLFTAEERVDLIEAALHEVPGVVTVDIIDGLLVDFCRHHGAGAIVKGLRFASDFDFELQMAHMNEHVGDIETVFLPASPEYGTVSSSMMRQMARFGGDVSAFLPAVANQALVARSRDLREGLVRGPE
ncbi:pantetheine-phosphate adenylyltransferase [Aestuariimicrobium sp. p3-SID1156]|uniref:pantetheine-phosphate adenylyltransferase n=1 Tax=Aestuariimicrobium sp. p3-SID1156 TaxID=2916038 RepID=UPI00223A74AD|nr:pantetheine-phosphate adenylyltransferase [Aestuariimicrobium sp. p3-SID1156]MCT1459653.1 pantetheine-phosphate adenylyltransferase [Aestuariimicrobium sp. p3-SID1156]